MQRISVIILFFPFVIFLVSSASADRGLIPITPDVSVYEPGQKAIVAWNGSEEILILSTDVTSSAQTLVLELLPLPSQPKVEPASFRSFEEIQSMIWTEGAAIYGRNTDVVKGASVEVVFHERIGAHNITVVKAITAPELVEWVGAFLKANNVTRVFSLGEFEPKVKDYLGRGFQYYVLDLITISPDARSVDPILYRFNSSVLYYPLAITSAVPGETKITLFLLTTSKIQKDYYPLEKVFFRFAEGWKPVEFVLSKGELSKIDLRIGGLFEDAASLTILKYEGNPGWITTDIMIAENAVGQTATTATRVNVDVELILPSTLIALSILLGAACTLAGVVVAVLMTRPRKEVVKTVDSR